MKSEEETELFALFKRCKGVGGITCENADGIEGSAELFTWRKLELSCLHCLRDAKVLME